MMSRVPSTAVDGNRLAVRVQEGLHPVGDDAILPPEPVGTSSRPRPPKLINPIFRCAAALKRDGFMA
jgi:hypothetical protein